MLNSTKQSAGAVDLATTPALHTDNTNLTIVEAALCRCRKPHYGHETANMSTQINVMSSNESIGPIPTHPSTPETTKSTPTSRSTQPSDTPLEPSSSNIMRGTGQDRRKYQVAIEIRDLREELCLHCFLSSFFPDFDDNTYGERINSLPLLTEREFNLTSPSSEGTSPSTRVAWPVDKAQHLPLTQLLNEILGHFDGALNPDSRRSVRFITYDRPMVPVTPTSLEPDLLLIEERFCTLNQLRWKHPMIPLEINDDFWDALKQLGTYAREMLSARPGRQYCWALYFGQIESIFRLVLFTPDRVHYTQPVVITSEAGYREMATIIAALFSRPNILTIGEDSSRDSTSKLLPNGDWLEIQAIEFDKKGVVGRKTRILSVVALGQDSSGVGPTISEHGGSPASARKSGHTGDPPFTLNRQVSATIAKQDTKGPYSAASSLHFLTNPHEPISPDQNMGAHRDSDIPSSGRQESCSDLVVGYHLNEFRVNPDEEITFAEDRDHLKIGEFLVVKESWPLASRRDIEWDALRSCSRQLGVPEVVYKVSGKHPMAVVCTQEPRVPQHIALREKGHRLQEAESPRILLTAVLHAIIGHWNLFQKGWLHRDVSIGNVLMLTDPVTKLPPSGLSCLGSLTECRGMLIDCDAMLRLDTEHEPGLYRVCTAPFLSRRLVGAWGFGIKTFDQYFDDLESFAWVLLWALIEIAEANKSATVYDRHWMEILNTDDLRLLEVGKVSIVFQLRDLSKRIAKGLPKSKPTSLSDPFIEILYHWFDLISEKEDCGNSETLSPSAESTALYESFITFATEKMPDLPEKW